MHIPKFSFYVLFPLTAAVSLVLDEKNEVLRSVHIRSRKDGTNRPLNRNFRTKRKKREGKSGKEIDSSDYLSDIALACASRVKKR